MNPGKKHHAFLLTGSGPARARREESLIKSLNPAGGEIRRFEGAALKIEQARELRRAALQKAWEGNSKIFLLKTAAILPEAQAALLKIVEEPPDDTYFIFSLPSENSLLPTLRSRLFPLRLGAGKGPKETSPPGIQKALLQSAVFSKNREQTEEFLRGREFWLGEKLRHTPKQDFKRVLEILEDFFEIKKRFYQKTYYNKMLLEHLALSRAYLES